MQTLERPPLPPQPPNNIDWSERREPDEGPIQRADGFSSAARTILYFIQRAISPLPTDATGYPSEYRQIPEPEQAPIISENWYRG